MGACVTSTAHVGTVASPPTEQQLANDGSAQQQRALYERYSVQLEDGAVRIGDAWRPERSSVLSPDVDPDVRGYLSSEPGAREVLGGSRETLARGAVATMVASLPVMMAGVPVALLTGIFLVGAMDVLAWLYVALAPLRPVAAGLNVATSLTFTVTLTVAGLAGIIPGHVVGIVGAVIFETLMFQSHARLERATDAYNVRLWERIRAAAMAPDVTSPDATAPPPPRASPPSDPAGGHG
ncbi:MAG: hypothetical protein AB2A00_41310 [Myxococcota bacterium]